MCTNIATKTRVTGSATLGGGWANIDEASIGFDHATHLWREHAVRLDFVSTSADERVAVELDLSSARSLAAHLVDVITQAERSGVDG